MRVDLFDAALDVVEADTNVTSLLFIPKLSTDYSTLDFSDEKQEYMDTYQWGVKNNPVVVSLSSLAELRAAHRRPHPRMKK